MTYMYILKRILKEEKWWIFIYFKPIFYGKPYKKEVKDSNPCSLSTLGDPNCTGLIILIFERCSSFWRLWYFSWKKGLMKKGTYEKKGLMKKGLWYFRWKKDSDILDKKGLKRLYRKN